ncbi:vWA domain-containing protein [Mucilaginibacter sp. E4BP6]|jgi:Ca-activated chloride channel family protein|uniref:vWA domain-containing protein n=1 Tax=Mucilaginibacter sp. E4BP6 TaxID=2723089 RepID=UPI0015C94571|nr:VWA domain-containing protein [Mucilaginibacter sp. E4BP6]NYE67408.1 Ca-activated chloride channel family protein [Mucilaginibacter sp. E4BP6]
MLRFANAYILWALVLVPLLIIIFMLVRRWKKKALASLGDKGVITRIMPQVSSSRPTLKFIFFIVAYTLLIIGLADPQVGNHIDEVKKKGADIMIVLDVSNSMLSQDYAPSRLENAKRALAQLIDNLHEDRIGIIVFAGEPYVQMPITTDYSAAKIFLNTINTGMVPVQGTAIGAAIDLGVKSFDYKDGTGKAIILMTDGENHEDDAITAAQNAHDKGVVVHVIGFGSPQGAPIPIYENGKQNGFHLDSAGHTVISKLNEDMCKQVAVAGNGVYIRATDANSGLGIVMDQVHKMKQKTYDSKSFKDFEDRFQFFIAIALFLFIAEFFISNRKSLRLSNLKLFEVKKP